MRDIRLGNDVRTSDGEKVGTVDQIVVHPDSLDIVAIIVQEGVLFTKDRIVEMGFVDRVDINEDVILNITKDREEELPELVTERFVEADSRHLSRLSEMGYMTTPSAAGQVMVLSEPVDRQYAPAPDSPLQPAPAQAPNITDETNLPPNTVTIVEGTDVVDNTGEKVGTVDEIVYGADERIDAIIVSEGLLFEHHVRIPADWITSAGHDHIIIDRSAEEAERVGKID